MEELLKSYQTVTPQHAINWIKVGHTDDFPENAGACVKYNSKQIAVYHFTRTNSWYACQNLCPHKMEMVLSRGISEIRKVFQKSPVRFIRRHSPWKMVII